MPDLRIGIKQIENVVFGRVLEQSGIENGGGRHLGTGAVVSRLRSSYCPQLLTTTLFVRGSDVGESDWFARAYSDTAQAKQAVNDIKALVHLVNAGEERPVDDACGLEVIE